MEKNTENQELVTLGLCLLAGAVLAVSVLGWAPVVVVGGAMVATGYVMKRWPGG